VEEGEEKKKKERKKIVASINSQPWPQQEPEELGRVS